MIMKHNTKKNIPIYAAVVVAITIVIGGYYANSSSSSTTINHQSMNMQSDTATFQSQVDLIQKKLIELREKRGVSL